jgi:mRNA interferase MazF
MVKRGDVWLIAFDPTVGSEIRKTRPAIVISPDEIHDVLRMVIVAPMTTGSRPASFRIPVQFAGKAGLVVLDQIRAIDRSRFRKKLGRVEPEVLAQTLSALRDVFSEG